MALVYIEDNDPWLREYDACEVLFRDIMERITARNKHPKSSQTFASLSVNIRILLKQYSREVQQLKSKVDEAARLKVITLEEAERRTRQIELLQSKNIQLQKLYDVKTNDTTLARSNLFASTSAFADGGTTSWAADDDDNVVDDDDVKLIDAQVPPATDQINYFDQVVQEQDKGLEELRKVIARQKEIGQNISNEVDHQNEIIDSLSDHMDRTDASLVNKTRQVQNISTKDRTCGYWIVILILFICIVIVSLIN